MNHLDATALVSSTGEITVRPPPKTGLSENFKITSSLDNSFKKSIKRDEIIFTTLNNRKCWDIWHRKNIETTRVQDAEEVLNSDYYAATADETSLFKEK